jgi:hypothetical protein
MGIRLLFLNPLKILRRPKFKCRFSVILCLKLGSAIQTLIQNYAYLIFRNGILNFPRSIPADACTQLIKERVKVSFCSKIAVSVLKIRCHRSWQVRAVTEMFLSKDKAKSDGA